MFDYRPNILAAAATFAVSPAIASDNAITIDIDRYNLQSQAGYDAAARQISGAARRLCSVPGTRTVYAGRSERRCMEETRASAIRQLDEHARRVRTRASR
ncbi:UrcA family protein [Parasphingopyxis algicola]|uniref:UrcA family protein n=1 Tax=Parasphingopyxis algicola TaxID=2026624 RepID=UPI0015A090E7|nr:UrcA family protein [Parasphingopyxis algicola]QLC25907.1 UrcA family protein [Parasphingopyxis algicola]